MSGHARMENMDRWDIVLLVGAGYVATMALVRLMIRRRDQLLDKLRQQLKKEKLRKEKIIKDRDNLGQRGKAA